MENICKVDEADIHDIFKVVLNNKSFVGQLRDDTLFIYSSFLLSTEDGTKKAIEITRDLSLKYPNKLEYKIGYIKSLLING